MGVGTNLKEILRDRKMTIKQLSEKAAIPLNTLYSITKRDSERVDRVILNRIAAALNIDPYDLMNFDQALEATVDDINAGIQYKAQVEEIMEKVTTEGLRIGKEVFETIVGNPKYQLNFDPIPYDDELEQTDTTPPSDAPETPPEGE